MQGTSADDFFQTDRDLAIAAERARKQQRIAAQQQPLLLADRARAPLASFNIKSKPLCWAFVRGTFRAVIGEFKPLVPKSGKSLQLFRGHSGPVTCIEIQYDHSSSTGETPRCVFTGSWDKTVKKFDFETGAELATFKAHSDFIKSIVLMPASAFPDAANLTVPVLVSASSDSTIRVWTTAESSSTPLKTWKSHTRPVESLAVYTDSITSELTLCSASSDTTIRKWDVGSGTVTSTFNGHLTSVNGIKIHESIDDGELTLWSFSADKTAKRWDLEVSELCGV
ncbi:hypothetical protein HDU83_004114 [Entophlyctis luteolus]|nr:hypothetical protein HDU83_004114 [Entophlyctis luteolus]